MQQALSSVLFCFIVFFFRKAWLSSFSFPQCSWLIFLPSNPLSNERKILLLHGIVLPGVPGPPTNLWGERKTASLYLQEQKQLLLFESQFISQSVGWKLELKSNFIDRNQSIRLLLFPSSSSITKWWGSFIAPQSEQSCYSFLWGNAHLISKTEQLLLPLTVDWNFVCSMKKLTECHQ